MPPETESPLYAALARALRAKRDIAPFRGEPALRGLEELDPAARAEFFPGQDGHPSSFVARPRLVVPLDEADLGDRPAPRQPAFQPGLQVLDIGSGRTLRSVALGQAIQLSAHIRNLGNTDAAPTNVEFFAAFTRIVTETRTRPAPRAELVVEDVFSIMGIGTVTVGRLIEGRFSPGDRVVIGDGGPEAVILNVQRATGRTGPVGLLFRGIPGTDMLGTSIFGKTGVPQTVTRRRTIAPRREVSAVRFLDVRYIHIPCERAATVELPWTVDDPDAQLGRASALHLFVRAYCYHPRDLPADLDRLDPVEARQVGAVTLKLAPR